MSYALKVRYTGTLQQSIYYVRDTTACTHAVIITFRYVITIPVEALVLWETSSLTRISEILIK
jgi:hypothetical protein